MPPDAPPLNTHRPGPQRRWTAAHAYTVAGALAVAAAAFALGAAAQGPAADATGFLALVLLGIFGALAPRPALALGTLAVALAAGSLLLYGRVDPCAGDPDCVPPSRGATAALATLVGLAAAGVGAVAGRLVRRLAGGPTR